MRESKAEYVGMDAPVVLRWEERDVRWRVAAPPFSDKLGRHGVTAGPAINGASVLFFPYYLPFGQARPFHIGHSIEAIIFMLEGEIEWGIGPNRNELEHHRLGRYDTLFVPRGWGSDHRNVGQSDARYVITIGQVDARWPDEVIYDIPGEDNTFSRPFK